jgi:hypothetical protein
MSLFREAAGAFREVARLQEPGWSGEAARNAEREEIRQRSRPERPLPGDDPRLTLRAMRAQATREREAGRTAQAEQLLLEAVRDCRQLRPDANCWE